MFLSGSEEILFCGMSRSKPIIIKKALTNNRLTLIVLMIILYLNKCLYMASILLLYIHMLRIALKYYFINYFAIITKDNYTRG